LEKLQKYRKTNNKVFEKRVTLAFKASSLLKAGSFRNRKVELKTNALALIAVEILIIFSLKIIRLKRIAGVSSKKTQK
jgi:D-alanyl-lipoteichoic acid acyltransferase DltB (MBOAT superfamily)